MAAVCSDSRLLMLHPFSMVDISASSADSQMRQASAPVSLIASFALAVKLSMVALHASKKVMFTSGMPVLQVELMIVSQVAKLS